MTASKIESSSPTSRRGHEFSESSDTPLEAEDYRLLSKAAVGAVILAFLSPLAFLSELFWLTPFAAIAFGAFALWSVARDPTRLSGNRLAMTGVIVGAFVLAFVVSESIQRQSLLSSHARRYAESWLTLLRQTEQDRLALYQADQLMMPYDRRQPAGVPLEEHYAEPDQEQLTSVTPMVLEQMPARELERTFNGEPLKSLVEALRRGAEFEYQGVDTTRRFGATGVEQVAPIFRIKDAARGEHDLIVVMRRTVYGEEQKGASHWSVDGVANVGDPLPPAY